MFAPRGKGLLVYRPDKGNDKDSPANVNTPAPLTVGGDSKMTAEGSVYRRKDGRWVAQYMDARGKVRYVYRKTKGKAKKALREAQQTGTRGTYQPRS